MCTAWSVLRGSCWFLTSFFLRAGRLVGVRASLGASGTGRDTSGGGWLAEGTVGLDAICLNGGPVSKRRVGCEMEKQTVPRDAPLTTRRVLTYFVGLGM